MVATRAGRPDATETQEATMPPGSSGGYARMKCALSSCDKFFDVDPRWGARQLPTGWLREVVEERLQEGGNQGHAWFFCGWPHRAIHALREAP